MGLKLAGPGWARAGPGLGPGWARAGKYSFAGCGPGLHGSDFPGPGPGRAYSESHSCFNIMVKDYPNLSTVIRSVLSML